MNIIPDTAPRGYAGTPWAVIDFSADLKLKDKDYRVLLALLRHLKKGSTLISPSQARLKVMASCEDRCLRYALRHLEDAHLIVVHRTRDRLGRYKGNVYDLAGVLSLLPEKALKALSLPHLFRHENAGGPQQGETRQHAMEFHAVSDANPSIEGGPTLNKQGSGHRQEDAGPEQKQALLAEQQSADRRPEPERQAQTEEDRVVALLCREWKDGTKLAESTARKFFKRFGAPFCLDQLEALPYRHPRQSWAGMLRDSLQHEWPFPPELVAHRREQQKAAARAASRVPVPGICVPLPRHAADADKELHCSPNVPETLREPWERVLVTMAGQVNRPTFEAHIRTLQPLSLSDGGRLIVRVTSQFTREWIAKRHQQTLELASSLAFDRRITVKLVLPEKGTA